MTSPHIVTPYRAKPADTRYPHLLPIYHFRCSCGHKDTTRYAPVGLELAVRAHVAEEVAA